MASESIGLILQISALGFKLVRCLIQISKLLCQLGILGFEFFNPRFILVCCVITLRLNFGLEFFSLLFRPDFDLVFLLLQLELQKATLLSIQRDVLLDSLHFLFPLYQYLFSSLYIPQLFGVFLYHRPHGIEVAKFILYVLLQHAILTLQPSCPLFSLTLVPLNTIQFVSILLDFLLSQLQLLLLLIFQVLHVADCFHQIPLGLVALPFDYDVICPLVLQLQLHLVQSLLSVDQPLLSFSLCLILSIKLHRIIVQLGRYLKNLLLLCLQGLIFL